MTEGSRVTRDGEVGTITGLVFFEDCTIATVRWDAAYYKQEVLNIDKLREFSG